MPASRVLPPEARAPLRGLWRRWASAGLLLGAALSSVACGSGALEREVASLRSEVVRLQNTQDRLEERLAIVESGRAAAATAASAPAARVERPALKVVKLAPGVAEPGAEEPSAEEAEEPERPVIKVDGSGRPAKRSFEGVRPAQESEKR